VAATAVAEAVAAPVPESFKLNIVSSAESFICKNVTGHFLLLFLIKFKKEFIDG
jgi:hypothetical protein